MSVFNLILQHAKWGIYKEHAKAFTNYKSSLTSFLHDHDINLFALLSPLPFPRTQRIPKKKRETSNPESKY